MFASNALILTGMMMMLLHAVPIQIIRRPEQLIGASRALRLVYKAPVDQHDDSLDGLVCRANKAARQAGTL